MYQNVIDKIDGLIVSLESIKKDIDNAVNCSKSISNLISEEKKIYYVDNSCNDCNCYNNTNK